MDFARYVSCNGGVIAAQTDPLPLPEIPSDFRGIPNTQPQQQTESLEPIESFNGLRLMTPEVSADDALFRWSPLPDVRWYKLKIQRIGKDGLWLDEKLTNLSICQRATDCSISLSQFGRTLNPNKQYRWKIVAKTADGERIKTEWQRLNTVSNDTQTQLRNTQISTEQELRDAIDYANNNCLDSSNYELVLAADIILQSALPDITCKMSISGDTNDRVLESSLKGIWNNFSILTFRPINTQAPPTPTPGPTLTPTTTPTPSPTPSSTPAPEEPIVVSDYRISNLIIRGGKIGINIVYPSLTLDNVKVTENDKEGIKILGGDLLAQNSEISLNGSRGISANGWTVTIDGTDIVGNQGGGIGVVNTDLKVTNSMIRDNVATTNGGGISVTYRSSLEMINSAVTQNVTTGNGGGINSDIAVTINDSLISGNTATEGSALYISGSATQTISMSCIVGNTGATYSVYAVDETNPVSAINNWWGDPNGPSTTTVPTSGDSINDNVDGSAPLSSQPDCGLTPPEPELCEATFVDDFDVYDRPRFDSNRIATVLSSNTLDPITVLGQYRDSQGQTWLYLEHFRDGFTTGWILEHSGRLDTLSCNNIPLVGQQGQEIPQPPTDDLSDNCLFMMPRDGIDVFSLQQITDKTNGGTISPIDTLAIDTPVLVKDLHPNRQYLEIDYYDLAGTLHTNWIIRTDPQGVVISETAECLLNITPDPTRLPVCQAGQLVNCRPALDCDWIFGCGENTDYYTWASFGSTVKGCSNELCKKPDEYGNLILPCPEWPEDDNRHCGTDLVTRADYDDGDITARQTVLIQGGILQSYSLKAGGVFKILTESNGNVDEIQYVHIKANELEEPRFWGQYVHQGIQLGNYELIGMSSREHVHAVIVLYSGNLGTVDLTQATSPLSPYYQSIGIPDITLP